MEMSMEFEQQENQLHELKKDILPVFEQKAKPSRRKSVKKLDLDQISNKSGERQTLREELEEGTEMAEEMRNKYEHMKNQFALNKQISEDFEKKSGRVIEFSD